MTSCFLEAEAFLPPVSGSSFQPVTYLLPALSHLMRQRKRSKTWISSLLQRVGFGFTVVSVWIWIGWSNAQVKNAPLLPLSGDESWENEQKQGVHCFPAKALALSVLDDFFPDIPETFFPKNWRKTATFLHFNNGASVWPWHGTPADGWRCSRPWREPWSQTFSQKKQAESHPQHRNVSSTWIFKCPSKPEILFFSFWTSSVWLGGVQQYLVLKNLHIVNLNSLTLLFNLVE